MTTDDLICATCGTIVEAGVWAEDEVGSWWVCPRGTCIGDLEIITPQPPSPRAR